MKLIHARRFTAFPVTNGRSGCQGNQEKKEQFFPRKSLPPIFSALHRFCADVGQYYEDAKGYHLISSLPAKEPLLHFAQIYIFVYVRLKKKVLALL